MEHDRTRTLHGLLRGELAAAETYRQALNESEEASVAAALQRMLDEHEGAVTTLREFVIRAGEEPEEQSGVWGAVARAVEGTSRLFGNGAALRALREGEEHGLREYERALADPYLDPELKSRIRNTLLPRQRAHARALDRLIDR